MNIPTHYILDTLVYLRYLRYFTVRMGVKPQALESIYPVYSISISANHGDAMVRNARFP